MEEMLSTLKEKILNLSDDELRKIVFVDSAEYEKEYVDLAGEELSKRYKCNFYEKHGLSFKELLSYLKKEDAEARLQELLHDEDDKICKYLNFLENLKKTPEGENPEGIYINMDYTNDYGSDYLDSWHTSGFNSITGEICSIQYCTWKEWLSFLIKNEQLKQLGLVDYAIICISEMTSVSFDEKEISETFEDILDKNINKSEELDIHDKELVSLGNFIKEGIGDFSIDKEILHKGSEKNQSVRPWIRFFARGIDINIFFYIVKKLFLIPIFAPYKFMLSYSRGIPLNVICYFIWIFIEALLLSRLGYTLGKWVLNVKIRSSAENKLSYSEALRRAWKVLLYGEGLVIPIIEIYTNVQSYRTLKNFGITKWDKEGELTVTHYPIEKYKAALGVLLYFLPCILLILFRNT